MLYGLDGLVHDTIVRSNHQDDDVSDQGSPRPHGCKRCVTRRVQECDLLSGRQLDWREIQSIHTVMTNVLWFGIITWIMRE